MNDLLNIELKVIKKRKASWVILVFLLAFLSLNYLLLYFAPNIPIAKEFLLPKNAMKFSLVQLGNNGLFIAAIFGGMFFGSPFSWRTYETRLTQNRGRTKIFTGKLLASLIVLLAWLIIGLAVGHVISFSLGTLEGSLGYSTPGFLLTVRAGLFVLIAWFSWFMVGGGIALWSKSTAMGIGFALAYGFLEEIILAIPGFTKLIKGYSYFFPGKASSSLIQNMFSEGSMASGAGGAADFSIGATLPVVFGYLIGLALLSWWRFKTMELAEH